MLRVFFLSKNLVQEGSTEQEAAESTPPTGNGGKTFIEKMEAKRGHYLIGYSLTSCLIWKSLVGCL